MIYELIAYPDGISFNKDARRRNYEMKNNIPPNGYGLWWKVEQMFIHDSGKLDVLWSRPEPSHHR